MNPLDDLSKVVKIMMHPDSVKKPMRMGDVLGLYIRASIIPLIIAIVVWLALALAISSNPYAMLLGRGFAGNFANSMNFGTGILVIGSIFIPIAYLLVLLPVSMIINAALYQLFAKVIFKVWKKPYSNTLTATTFATFPTMMLFWSFMIPIIGIVLEFAAAIWAFIILIIALANMQKISGWRAFGGILISGAATFAIAFVIVLAFVLAFATA